MAFQSASLAQRGTRKGLGAQEHGCARARACSCLAACSPWMMMSYLPLAVIHQGTCSGRA